MQYNAIINKFVDYGNKVEGKAELTNKRSIDINIIFKLQLFLIIKNGPTNERTNERTELLLPVIERLLTGLEEFSANSWRSIANGWSGRSDKKRNCLFTD